MPENRILPPERQVDCSCDAGLEMPVLIEQTGRNERVTACLSCGKLEFVECLVDEPRPNDVRCMGNRVIAIDPPLRQWLEQWPRRDDVRYPASKYAFFPATTRCKDASALAGLRERIFSEQDGMSYRERLLKAGFPAGPPPAELPRAMEWFASIWTGLTMSLDAEMSVIFDLNYNGYAASPFAGTKLLDRADIRTEVFRRLESKLPDERKSGYNLLPLFHLTDPAIFAILIRQLKQVSVKPVPGSAWNLQDGEWIDQLCNVLYYLSPESVVAVSALNELAERIGTKDNSVRQRVLQIAELLKRSN